jgi:hypothetical protein
MRGSYTGLAGPWIELGTKRESLLQVLDEYTNFGGQPAAGRPHRKDWHGLLKGSEKTNDGAFSEFCGEEPCWPLGDPQMFKDASRLAQSQSSTVVRNLARQKRPNESGGDRPATPVRHVA